MRVIASVFLLALVTSAYSISVRPLKHEKEIEVKKVIVKEEVAKEKVEVIDYKKYNVREKTEAYKKCAGAKGYPYVHYAPCPKGYECKEKDSYAKGDWGLYCLKKKKGSDKCYKNGARCMGAKNKPYVPYYPCCSSSSVCKEDDKLGWGSFCVDIGYKYKAPVKEIKEKKYEMGHGKCHATGKKCKGAKGYPYVEYGDGCCSKYDLCIEDKKYGAWGGYCVKVEEEEEKDDKKVVYIYKKEEEEEKEKKYYEVVYGYPVEKEEKDKSGHKFWGKKSVWKDTCINTNYFGCKVVAENEFYYRQAVVRMKDEDYYPCCKSSDICYRGYCKPKDFIPHGKTGGKPFGGGKVLKPKDIFPKVSPWL